MAEDSKFWASGGYSDDDDFDGDIYGSDDDFDDFDESSEEEEEEEVILDFEEEEVTEKLTGQDKKILDLQTAITHIKDQIEDEDWDLDWDRFKGAYDKLRSTFEHDGIPQYLVIFVSKLNDFIEEKTSKSKGKKKGGKAKKLVPVLKLKKVFAKWFDSQTLLKLDVDKYKKNPDQFSEDFEKPEDDEADTKEEEEKEEEEESWNVERIDKRMKELLDKRGTKNYDRQGQIKDFEELLQIVHDHAYSIAKVLQVMFHLINAQFDASPTMAQPMSIPLWKKCFNNIVKALEILVKNKDVIELVDEEPDPEAKIPQLRCPIVSQVERLHEEFMKSLQALDEYTQEYVTRLKHEAALLKLTRAVFDFYQEMGDRAKVATLASRRLDHLYYKRDTNSLLQEELRVQQQQLVEKQQEDRLRESKKAGAKIEVDDENLLNPDVPDDTNLIELVPELCRIIYTTSDDEFPDSKYPRSLKAKSILQHIYHLALHDNYYEARDLMLMTRIHEAVQLSSDTSPKILYNRALVQLGLAAFRKGLFQETQVHLADFMSQSTKYREWLAQGVYKTSEKTQEEERLERLRQVPYPMFINLDLLEFAHLTSSMLHDVTNIFLNDSDKKKASGSKGYKKLLDQAEKNLSGPPESIKENIVEATNALKEGDWKKCSQYLLNLDVWKIIHNHEHVKPLLELRIKEESLRAFILKNANNYISVSSETLSSMFSLPDNRIHSILCKMIINGEFNAYWDMDNKCYVTKSTEVSHLSYLRRQFNEIVAGSEGLRGNIKDKEVANVKKRSYK